uniref:Uncharacterized protein n=1 Tax=viral metagenome TaxID=1070528 RepID=A0A6C0ETW4_9ZZZZ
MAKITLYAITNRIAAFFYSITHSFFEYLSCKTTSTEYETQLLFYQEFNDENDRQPAISNRSPSFLI